MADRRTSQHPGVGRGALESPSAGLQPAAKPSQLPTHCPIPTKKPGVFVTPGLRLHARGVRGRASRPQGIERERTRRRSGGSLRFLATQDVTRTSGKHERPRCKGCLGPTRLGADLTARPSSCTLSDAAPSEDVRAIPRRLSGSLAGTSDQTASSRMAAACRRRHRGRPRSGRPDPPPARRSGHGRGPLIVALEEALQGDVLPAGDESWFQLVLAGGLGRAPLAREDFEKDLGLELRGVGPASAQGM